VQMIATAFTDHFGVVETLTETDALIRWGRRSWKMNYRLLTSNYIMDTMLTNWKEWQRRQYAYPNMTSWWVRLCKPRIRQLCRQEEAARWREFRQLENLYYHCIYEIVKDRGNIPRAFSALNQMRAKIVQLNSRNFIWHYRILSPPN
jgi:hypothetical protein